MKSLLKILSLLVLILQLLPFNALAATVSYNTSSGNRWSYVSPSQSTMTSSLNSELSTISTAYSVRTVSSITMYAQTATDSDYCGPANVTNYWGAGPLSPYGTSMEFALYQCSSHSTSTLSTTGFRFLTSHELAHVVWGLGTNDGEGLASYAAVLSWGVSYIPGRSGFRSKLSTSSGRSQLAAMPAASDPITYHFTNGDSDENMALQVSFWNWLLGGSANLSSSASSTMLRTFLRSYYASYGVSEGARRFYNYRNGTSYTSISQVIDNWQSALGI